jgi:hypothetical protein
MDYGNGEVLASIARRLPGGEWVSDRTYVVYRDAASVAWLHAPERSNVISVSFSFNCDQAWLRSFAGRLVLWTSRRKAKLAGITITVDDEEPNLRVWRYLIGQGFSEFDPWPLLKELRAIGMQIQHHKQGD